MQKCLGEKGKGRTRAVMLVCRGACLVESRLSEEKWWPSTKDEKRMKGT